MRHLGIRKLPFIVLEFVYDYNENRFKPIRLRLDKPTSNFISVAENVLETIRNPITEETITTGDISKSQKITNLPLSIVSIKSVNEVSDDVLIMRDFHNWIKSDLIKRFAYKAGSLLDLAVGRAGDLNKWKKSKIQRVVGIDISKEFIEGPEGAIERYNKMLSSEAKRNELKRNTDLNKKIKTISDKSFVETTKGLDLSESGLSGFVKQNDTKSLNGYSIPHVDFHIMDLRETDFS